MIADWGVLPCSRIAGLREYEDYCAPDAAIRWSAAPPPPTPYPVSVLCTAQHPARLLIAAAFESALEAFAEPCSLFVGSCLG